MNTKNKYKTIQFKTMSYLIIFSIIILIVMWAFQILFLKTYYEIYQIKSLNNIVNELKINTYTVNELETLAYNNDICMEYVIENKSYLFNGLNKDCLLNKKNNTIKKILNNFISKNQYKEMIKLNNPINNSKSILYNIKLSDIEYIFLNTALEDVNSTTSILTSQLIYVTFIVIIVAVIVSIYLSKMLNKPIINIIREAKKLAKGNKVNIEKSNIYEIDELANVLNYASLEINKTDELRRDLLANVSHDLKTPLTMIKAYAEMIRDININDENKIKENLNIIIDETDRLNVLVNDLLNLSKLESSSEKLEKSEFDLVKLIKSIIKKYNIIKEMENYKFNLKLPKKALVSGDINKISQVIYNLINNAINYTGNDLSVTIEVKELKNTYLVNIIDTGKGIKEDEVNIIWDKYYKNEKNHKRNKIGTGIGLSIVKNILERHKFKYGVKSKLNKGTTFYFEITKIS